MTFIRVNQSNVFHVVSTLFGIKVIFPGVFKFRDNNNGDKNEIKDNLAI